MNRERLEWILAGALLVGWVVVGIFFVYRVGYVEGRHSMPVAIEPRCEIVMERGKVVKLTCPDSTWRMP